MLSQQPYYDTSSGAKVVFSFVLAIFILFLVLLSLLVAHKVIATSCVASAQKVRIRLRAIIEITCATFRLNCISCKCLSNSDHPLVIPSYNHRSPGND